MNIKVYPVYYENKVIFLCDSIVINKTILFAFRIHGEEEKSRGHYIAKDRQGNEQKIPLLGVAIAVVQTNSLETNHFGKVVEIAAELKEQAEKYNESRYVINRSRK